MTPNAFRKLALALPEATESEHQGHPDFRVRNKVFATLGPDGDWAMVKLTPAEQAILLDADPVAFEAFAGAWGKRGCTKIVLAKADRASVAEAVQEAWRNTAPKTLVAQFDQSE